MSSLHAFGTWTIAVLAALMLAGSPARASLVEALDLPALVERADEVVVARVISLESSYDEHRRIVTDVRMQVERVEKGSHAEGASIVVRRLGGSIGDLSMRVDGEPSFEMGELVLLFGRRFNGPETLRPVGMSQGAMRISEQRGERWVRSAPDGAALVRRGVDGALTRAQAAVTAPRKLDDLLQEIRALIEKRKK